MKPLRLAQSDDNASFQIHAETNLLHTCMLVVCIHEEGNGGADSARSADT